MEVFMTGFEMLILGVVLTVGQAVAAVYVKASIEGRIRHDYERDLETLRYELRQREQAVMVAELLAEWGDNPSDLKRLNKLAFQASLWLPSDIVTELAKVLSYTSGAKDPKDILVAVRRHIKGQDDGITTQQIVHFPKPKPSLPEA
jgi:hypothetical protein